MTSPKDLPKIIVVLGPTASGKSALAVKLAKQFNGAIISADSRQVYKHMNIGTGKITPTEMDGVPHYLLDIANPNSTFTVNNFQTKAKSALKKIIKAGQLPIIAGGTGFYIDALIYNFKLPPVKSDPKLRSRLNKKSPRELFKMLQKLDPVRASTIDPNNPHRLVRALEIVITTKQPIPILKKSSPYNILKIGLDIPKDKLIAKITKRVTLWLKQGLLQEVKDLHNKHRLSWQKITDFGFIYHETVQYLNKEIPKSAMIDKIITANLKYAKRQLTWWRQDKDIYWLSKYSDASKLIKNFLK